VASAVIATCLRAASIIAPRSRTSAGTSTSPSEPTGGPGNSRSSAAGFLAAFCVVMGAMFASRLVPEGAVRGSSFE
jgi:hypothetical protein